MIIEEKFTARQEIFLFLTLHFGYGIILDHLHSCVAQSVKKIEAF